VKVVISTDAHESHALSYIRYGVTMARRGWLTAADVINTRSVTQFLAALRPKPGSVASPDVAKKKAAPPTTASKNQAARKANR